MKKKKGTRPTRKYIAPKECAFCKENKEPWYSDVETLQRFLTERGKIIGQARSGLCSMHQRRLTRAIKHARHLALLPFVVRD